MSRRRFLGTAALGSVAAGAVLAGCDSPADDVEPAAAPSEPFFGEHQMGILADPDSYGVACALDVSATDKQGLADVFSTLSMQLAALVSEPAVAPTEPMKVPEDNSVLLGQDVTLRSATVLVGASLFDDRFGLATVRPTSLVEMPAGLAREALDARWLHGDLLVLLQGAQPDIVAHGVRRVTRALAGKATVRWMLNVFNTPDTTPAPDTTSTRNLMGFKDGTGNPDVAQDDLMDDVVWCAGVADGEPDWCAGGSYVAVRISRMFLEQWDAETLDHQEKVFGRAKVSGAPLDGTKETDVPVYPKDPGGAKIPLTAHIRLANPRDGKAKLMLRRSMSYAKGIAADGSLDQGLLFVSYQRTMQAFLEAQARLKGEPMEQFVVTEGGGFFFALPGPAEDAYLGKSLIDAAD